MVIIFAIFATVLLGAVAIATDLSVSTHYRRSVQNVTDAAALAGAKKLPITVTATDTSNAVQEALTLVHNSYPWQLNGSNTPAKMVNAAGCGGGTLQCSVTVCAGMTSTGPACTKGPQTSLNASQPYVLTVNAPPLTALVNGTPPAVNYNGDSHRIEVVMRQTTGGFFNAFVGGNNQDAAQSIGYHFAANQPFPFALFSRTIIQSGNQGENIAGNVYADRYIYPQSNGQAGICAGPAGGNPGYIFLGYPQLDDGSPPYQNDGQSSLTHGYPIQDNVTCPTSAGTVGNGLQWWLRGQCRRIWRLLRCNRRRLRGQSRHTAAFGGPAAEPARVYRRAVLWLRWREDSRHLPARRIFVCHRPRDHVEQRDGCRHL